MTDQEQREILKQWRPWLRAVARNFCARVPGKVEEDLAQIGWIAIWRQLHKDNGSSDPLLKTAAIRDMQDVIRKNHAQRRDVRRSVPGGLPYAEASGLLPNIWTQLQCDLGEVELAYHHGEIADALDCLTPRQRQYVVLKFWYGYGHAEMVEHFGYRPDGQLWSKSRELLARELAHLA